MERWLWVQRQDIGPQPRAHHAMVYDAGRRRVLLFGGFGPQNPLGDTWEWDGSVWTQTADTGPSPRASSGIAYDEVRDRVVLFGGSGATSRLADTWEWNGDEWTQVADTGPSARKSVGMVFHAALQRVILVGGFPENQPQPSSALGDTWQWDGLEWTQIADTGPRLGDAGACYDPARKCVVVFGGSYEGQYRADTWEFQDGIWRQRQNMGPGPSSTPALVRAATRTILFGGDTQTGQTWQWDGQRWTQRQNMGPLQRDGCRLAYDAQRDRVVLFGGEGTGGLAGDTWELTIA
jgi:hypothetical protein